MSMSERAESLHRYIHDHDTTTLKVIYRYLEYQDDEARREERAHIREIVQNMAEEYSSSGSMIPAEKLLKALAL